VIFLEETLREGGWFRSLVRQVEERVLGCGRDETGKFIEKNQCQDDGQGGGLRPPRDESWDQSDDLKEWSQDDLKESSPISGGEKVESLTIADPKGISSSMRGMGVQSLDDLVAIGGGAVREAQIAVTGDEDGITVAIRAPVDPSDPSSPAATSSVMVMPGWNEGDGAIVDYSNFHPGGNLSDAGSQEGGENNSRRLRVASILNQRMLESLEAAERSGAAKAVTMAVGSKGSTRDKGYRLWPQFGFDAKVPKHLVEKIPDEILLRAAGVEVPSQGTGRIPRAVVIKSLRQQVKGVTIQQLMQFREGENWWTENGSSIEMSLDLTDKQSLGYKRYEQKRSRLSRSRIRNEGRSLLTERRECIRDENGRFAKQNECQEEGSGGAPDDKATKAAKRLAEGGWRTSRARSLEWTQDDLKVASPIEGGDQVKGLALGKPKQIASALDAMGLKDLDTAVKIGGGAVRGAEIAVMPISDAALTVVIAAPLDPNDPEGSEITASVNLAVVDGETEVEYEGFSTPSGISNPERLEAGANDKERLRVASVMQERMIESLIAAEESGVARATTYAAGDAQSPLFQGYRLWPQFGFDAVLSMEDFPVPPEIVLASKGKSVPDDPAKAKKAADRITAKGFTLQQLISTREGKVWWDDNGFGIDMVFDLKDKKSPGYKKLSRLKKLLPKLKERNVSEGRDLFELLEAESRDDAKCLRNPSGQFEKKNECQEGGDGEVNAEAKAAKSRNVDVMLGGGQRVAVMDEQARARAIADLKANPKPEGSAPGSTTDLWERQMVTRAPGRLQKATGNVSDGKIASTDPVFSEDDRRNNGQFVAHDAVALYLSNRHEEARRETGAEGPGSIIDTGADEIPEAQMQYLVDSLTEDALHAYDVLGVDPGFYSTDLDETMRLMTQRYPEFENDDNSRFVFTTLLAITSSGQGPDANLRDADDLYRMYREHGTVVPDNYGGGARDAVASLETFQGLLDSFGPDRTRRLLSGYTTAGKIEEAFAKLAGKSQADEWRERTGSSAWSLPVNSKGKEQDMVSGELKDEVTPVAAIFGPKIGSFFANLSGRHEFLTMDRWLMRSVGRVSGELITRATPKQAKERAEAILESLESGKWSRAKLFGVDKSHGITKADLVRSLKIQARTGVIEENGAAFIWATAAERAYGKTPRPRPGGGKPGGYGKDEDPDVHALHRAGNSLFKSLIHEQQDPRSATARRNIREVFRRVQAEIEKKAGRTADIDEIQAALWQYEKRLWKHLGAKTNITDNSLFSAAAEGVLSGRLARSEDKPNLKPFRPASRRDYQPSGDIDPEFDANHFDVEQEAWNSDFADLGIDIIEVLKLLEDDVEERRNFAALDAVIEVRSEDCGRDEGGKFGDGNTCAGQVSNSKGESLRGVRRRDKTQTKVGRKLFQMRVPEKNLKSLVRELGGKVQNTLVEIDSTKGDEGVNVFVRDRDNNETHYIHIGYYGATIYTTDTVSSQEVSHIQSAAKEFLPKTIDNRLWGAGSEYPVYIVNSPDETSKQWAGLSAKQRLKKERRSADCGRQEGGKFGPKNECQKEGSGAGTTSDDSDLSDIQQIKGTGGAPVDIDRLPARQQQAVERIRQKGVSIKVESERIHDDAFALVEQGIATLEEFGLDWPREIQIGPNGAALASVHPDTGAVLVNESATEEKGRRAIEGGWFSGDAEMPLASILVHEQSHTDHYSTLVSFTGADAAGELWDKITGRYDMERLRREADKAGRPFRPSAGSLEEYAWSPGHRPRETSGVSASRAMRIAATVSQYAKTNPPEFVAEFRTGVLSGHEYSDEAWDLYESYAGPKLLRRKRK
jgi:hypothetical protein